MDAIKAAIDNCNRLTATEQDSLWQVRTGCGNKLIGRMLPEFAEQIVEDDSYVRVNKTERTITFIFGNTSRGNEVEAYDAHFVKLFETQSVKGHGFPNFEVWLNERYTHPVLTTGKLLEGIKMPSPLRGILGIITFGVHMTVYTKKTKSDGTHETYIWVATRSNNVTFPGMLDQIVAGAVSPEDNFTPQTTLIREASEEASIDVSSDRQAVSRGVHIGRVEPGSVIKFFDKKDAASGSEDGHIEPGIRFTCDMEVPWNFHPTVNEAESIASFDLKTISEVCADLKGATWKPNSGLVMADFLLRHKLVEGAGDVGELQAKLQPELGLQEPEVQAGWWDEKL